MVPYVRKSFYKHWCGGNKYICNGEMEDLYSGECKITDYPSNAAYRYAMDMTQRELNQAVEGMYHNL